MSVPTFEAIVVGGGPAGATSAERLAQAGRDVLLLDKPGRVKPCGGAIPPRLIRDFDIPDRLLCARAKAAKMVGPSGRTVHMPIDGGFVGMVDREAFDEFLRVRAQGAGAQRIDGAFLRIERDGDGAMVSYRPAGAGPDVVQFARARLVVGADGARSAVAKQALGRHGETRSVFAYHEIVEVPERPPEGYDRDRADIYYQAEVSPDFYGWVFPHGGAASIGVGSAHKGFPLRKAAAALRRKAGLAQLATRRVEGAPIPMKPLGRFDDGRAVILAGDAAGVVAPASGEGIYYAMESGRLAAEAALEVLEGATGRALASARRRFMKAHGQVFLVLGLMQHFWYRNDKRREGFVRLCADPDIQRLTWQAYMNKELVRAEPAAHARIFFKDLGQLLGWAAS